MSTVLVKLFYAIIVGFFTSGLLFGFYQAHLMLKELKQNTERGTSEPNFNKQQYVKDNRAIFGINDKECNDIKEIYTVSPKSMGF